MKSALGQSNSILKKEYCHACEEYPDEQRYNAPGSQGREGYHPQLEDQLEAEAARAKAARAAPQVSPGARKVYDAICQLWLENYQPPTIRQVMQLTGITSTSTIAWRYGQLRNAGWILPMSKPVPVWLVNAIKEYCHGKK